MGPRRRAAALCTGIAAALALLVPANAHAFGLIAGFGSTGAGAGQVLLATGMAVAPDGTVYLSDYGNYRVDVFSSNGTFVRAFGKGVNPAGGDVCTTTTGCQQGTPATSAGAMNVPTGIEIGADGLLYVADFVNNRIVVFQPDGTFVRAFGKGVSPAGGNVCTATTGCQAGAGDGSAGSLFSPTGMGMGPSGTIYISSANERIDVFSTEGGFIRAFGRGVNPSGASTCTAATGCQKGKEVEAAGGISYPWDVAVDANGRVAMSSGINRRVDIFSTDGTFLHAFGRGIIPGAATSVVGLCTTASGCRKGSESGVAGAFAYATGLVVNAAGNLVIADLSNHRISEFTFEGAFIRAFGEGVVNGAATLQVCTAATGCQKGNAGLSPGAIPSPFSTAVDCTGAIYATTYALGAHPFQVERFGEPGIGSPPCASAPAVAPEDASSSSFLPASKRSRAAKPTLEVELNKGAGTAVLVVIVSEPGTLLLKGKGIRKVRQRAKRAGLYELPVMPKGKTHRKLLNAGKAKVKLLLSFKPEDGAGSTQVKAVTLKRLAKF